MAKVKQPLLSLDARRKLGDDIVFKRQGRTAIVEKRPIPKDAKSPGQLSWRHMFLKVVALWHALSGAEKEAWESLGRKRHMTGYAWFVSQALRPNPGVYLPLQGGIMSGIIAMGTNSIIGLPHPTGSGHAARKSYVDAKVAAAGGGGGHPVILSWDYSSIGQGVWAIVINASQALNYFFNNTSNANGDNISYKLLLSAGTYTMRILYFSGPGSAIVDYYVDGVEKASIDGYAGANTPNQIDTTPGIVVPATKLLDIKAQVDGRNPLGVAWAASHTAIVFWRTA